MSKMITVKCPECGDQTVVDERVFDRDYRKDSLRGSYCAKCFWERKRKVKLQKYSKRARKREFGKDES